MDQQKRVRNHPGITGRLRVYLDALKAEDTDEAKDRLGNVQELYNAVLQLEEENEDPSLLGFLANASLTSDLDNVDEGSNVVSLDDPAFL